AAPGKRGPLALAFLFDTSLSQRFAGLEAGYRTLVRLLDALGPEDRFVVIPFDRTPAKDAGALHAATPEARRAALDALRARPLSPGTDVAAAVEAGRAAGARLVLFTDGVGPSGDLVHARGDVPLYTVLTGDERRESFTVASEAVFAASPEGGTADEEIFVRRMFAPAPVAAPAKEKTTGK